jgi:hypothetical protein
VLQTGAQLVWDIEFGKILSLASEESIDVRLEYRGCKWTIKTSQVDAVAKAHDDRVHSSGSSSPNAVAPLPTLDVRQTLAKFPLIDTQGNSAPMLTCISTTDASFRLLPVDRTLCCVRPQIPEAEETSRHCSRGSRRHLGPTHFSPVSTEISRVAKRFPNLNPVALPTTSSIRSCWTPVSIMSSTPPSRKPPMTDRSLCLPKSASLPSTQLRSPEASSILTMCYESGLPVGKLMFQPSQQLTRFIDTRVYNFTVYDEAGSVLVAITGLELRRNTTSSLPDVQRRYEVVLQPIVTTTVLPQCKSYWTRPDKETVNTILTVADHEAQLLLSRSLDRGVTVGDDLNRKRYYQFAKSAAARRLPRLPPPSVVEDIKAKWPIHFQIIDRLSRVHRMVFETSTVRLPLIGPRGIFLISNIPGKRSSPVLRRYTEQVLHQRRILRTCLRGRCGDVQSDNHRIR